MRAWRLIDSGLASGAWNLALDEAIFAGVRERRSPPTLRFYAWSSPTLSLGYAQDPERDLDLEACAAACVAVIRRATGGRAVLHDREVTYSVAVPGEEPPFGAGLDAAYRAVAAGLLAGLRLLGVKEASLAPGRRGGAHRPRHPGCFASVSRHEIVAGGHKLVGSAQRRSGGAFLQHGSILLEGHGAPLARLLRARRGATRAPGAMAGLADLLRPCPTYREIVAAVTAGCAGAWGVRLLPGAPTAGELAAAGAPSVSRCVDRGPVRTYHARMLVELCPDGPQGVVRRLPAAAPGELRESDGC
ncbi:MAG TPA: lipoate--protein ligase family protein [Candidatus Methanoperedens sp.]|nr:lipoate--protein ligase family protein [Candidatus Methanoperedens sp.]